MGIKGDNYLVIGLSSWGDVLISFIEVEKIGRGIDLGKEKKLSLVLVV